MPLEQQLDVCIRIIIAAFLSFIVGLNREREDHPAGLRTHMLVGVGAALFTGLSSFAFPGDEPGRVAANVIVGIGFLGGGMITGREIGKVKGLTTAAGIWAVAAIGMACGTSSYLVAIVATIMIWFVLAVLDRLEPKVRRSDKKRNRHIQHIPSAGQDETPSG
jgi:putative Mg2+ transporter-C (MgtC) family protein